LDLGSFTLSRTAVGGALTLGSGATLKTANSFPANFGSRTLAAASTVEYNGSTSQTISAENYGNLILSNGGSNAKTLAGATVVTGDVVIGTNATLGGATATLTVSGNWTNNGVFTASNGAVTLTGAGKTITGAN